MEMVWFVYVILLALHFYIVARFQLHCRRKCHYFISNPATDSALFYYVFSYACYSVKSGSMPVTTNSSP